MSYLYHFVPKNLQGHVLYPLNQLKDVYPKAYAEHMCKYIGREVVNQNRIPVLDCLWNDVLHFSAVNPKDIKQALIEAGADLTSQNSYYQIDPKLLDPKNTIVWLYSHAEGDHKNKMNPENFEPYNPETISKYSVLPQITKKFYRESVAKGERLLMHRRIPHILYKDTLNVSNIPVVNL